MKTLIAADLFAGCGGFSTGFLQAAGERNLNVNLLAINHWETAVETHTRNHPGVRHLCQSVEGVGPRDAVPGGYLDLLLASPECIYHSRAGNGKPKSEQSRAGAYHVLHWCQALDVQHVILENVREWLDWGPLYPSDHPDPKKRSQPIPTKRGSLFRHFVDGLKRLGYTVDWRLLCAADFGDPTTRTRLFLQARKGRKKIAWPEPTHQPADTLGLYAGAQPWRVVREIIDWSVPGKSIYNRKKPLVPNTMARILTGLARFGGLPFLCGCGGPSGQGHPQSVDAPIGTILAENHRALVEPFLVVFRNHADALSLDVPLPTLCAGGGHMALAEPYVVVNRTHADASSIDAPLRTLTTGGNMGLAQPFLIKYHGGKDGARRSHSLDEPLRTLDTSNRIGLCSPYLVSFYGTGGPRSIDLPLGTQTTKDRFALVTPELVRSGAVDKGDIVGWLDILFRMLMPRELARGMSFPDTYEFAGKHDEQVKQVGNAVGVQQARALCRCALEGLR